MENFAKNQGPGDMGNFEPLNPTERVRQDENPVALRDIGGSNYYNSILAALFNIPWFTKVVIEEGNPLG